MCNTAPASKETLEEYNVACVECGCVFSPSPKSPLWWRARQHYAKYPNLLSAMMIGGKQCGCVESKQIEKPDAPYRVSGYNDLCEDFNIPFFSFTAAVAQYKEMYRGPYVVFISGISESVWRKIEFG